MSEPGTTPSHLPNDNHSADASAPLLAYASGLHPPLASDADGEIYRQGPTLIVANGSTLPPRCILCGEPGAGPPIRLTLTWDSSFRLTFHSTLELRTKASVHAFLCPGHRQTWARARSIGGIGFLAAVSLMFGGIGLSILSESSTIPRYTPLGLAITIAGFALAIVALFFFTLRSQTLTCSRIQEGYLYLQGAADAFLDSLPELPKK
jgi:hypothetical protein